MAIIVPKIVASGKPWVFRSGYIGRDAVVDQAPLAKAGVPILHLSGSLDPWLNTNTRVAEKRYKDLGGKLTVIVREGEGHFLSLKDPKPIVDFIAKSLH